jgi:hypothetical protein
MHAPLWSPLQPRGAAATVAAATEESAFVAGPSPAPCVPSIHTAGSTGSTRLNLSHLDPTGLVGMQLWQAPGGDAGAGAPRTGALLLCVSPSKRYFRGIQTHIDNAVHGVMQVRRAWAATIAGSAPRATSTLQMPRGPAAALPRRSHPPDPPPHPAPPQGYLVGVTVKGVGYRLEPADASDVIKAPPGAPPSGRVLFWEAGGEKVNVAYPHKQPSHVVRLKVRRGRARSGARGRGRGRGPGVAAAAGGCGAGTGLLQAALPC